MILKLISSEMNVTQSCRCNLKVILVLLVTLLAWSVTMTYATEDEAPRRYTEIESLSWSPNGKVFVFSTNRRYEGKSGFYLWCVDINGKALKQLTFPAKNKQGQPVHYKDSNPQWSPDGKQIVFDSDRGETRHGDPARRLRQVFICDPAGQHLRQISSGQGWFDNKQPAWSPDGKYLAWVTTRNASADIMLATAQGKELRYLAVSSQLAETYPSWSYNGLHIAFTAKRERTRKAPPSYIYLRSTSPEVKPQTTKPQVLVTYPDEFGLIGVCSPTDSVLAVFKGDTTKDLWLINLDGTDLRQVTNFLKKGLSAENFVRPAWSPKGNIIAFVDLSKHRLPADVYEDGIWICNVTDGSVEEVPIPLVVIPM